MRIALQSVAQLASGYWRLVKIRKGRRPRPIVKQVEVFLYARGEGFITEEGRRVFSWQFSNSAPYAYIRFRLDEENRSQFGTNRRGKLEGEFRISKKSLFFTKANLSPMNLTE